MRMTKWFVIGALLVAAMPAAAQSDDKKVNFNIGGGYTFALSDVRNYLGDGYNVNVGLIFNVKPTVGFQVEYGFNGLGQKQVQLPVSPTPSGSSTDQPFYADMNMQFVDFNLIVKPKTSGKAAPYLIAGIGYYYRPVKVTTPSVGYVPGYCSPWWYVCYPGGWVPTTSIIGSRSSSDFGMDFGVGVNVKAGDSASVYFEARYHYIWGPEVTDSTGKSYGKATGQFFPITFGVRF
jgi:opacity protein-like surface antigen